MPHRPPIRLAGAILLGVLAGSPVAQAADPSELHGVHVRLQTSERAVFDAVLGAALPACKSLGAIVQRPPVAGAPAQYELRGACPAVTQHAQAEALRAALFKAFGEAPGSLEVMPMAPMPPHGAAGAERKPADKAAPAAHKH